MRCTCCNKLLTEAEATAKFVDSGNYVDMCSGCREYLPKDLMISIRKDLETTESYEDTEPSVDDYWDLGAYGDDD
jgi:hypothetical protein